MEDDISDVEELLDEMESTFASKPKLTRPLTQVPTKRK